MIHKFKKIFKKLKTFGSLTVLRQLIDPTSIPFIIINYNQLFYFKKLVEFAIKSNFKKIVIIDNVSTYQPLLDYYKKISLQGIIIEHMDKNYGHMVLFEESKLYNKYCKGFFILSDADIVPNENLPDNFIKTLMYWLFKRYDQVTKVGFAMNLEDIPDYYPQKNKVLEWEKQFWHKPIKKNVYLAKVDTTFALYKPNFKNTLKHRMDFYNGIRIAGNFSAQHGGWYIDYDHLTNEQQFYINTASKVSSWVIEKGEKY